MAHGKWWAITSLVLLFAASYATAQVPTPIRSVSSLPATCKGGSATQSSDMVVLIVAGVGTNFLCTSTNTWTQVAGGSSSPPGGATGSIQYNNGAAVFGGVTGELVATSFSGADICAQVEAAIAALPTDGGTVKIPAGNYTACAGTGGIGITISKSGVTIAGAGKGNSGTTAGATILNFAAGVTGFDITGGFAQIRDMFLISADSGSNTDDGIRNRGFHAVIQRLAIRNFGRNGILTQGISPQNADSWHYEDIESSFNFGDGYQWGTPCNDNHQGVATLLSSSINQGWGFNVLCGGNNIFDNPLVQGNVTGGYHVAFSWNTFYNAYAESGTGSSFVIETGAPYFASGTRVWFNAFGMPATVTNNGATAIGNELHYFGVDNWNVQNGLWLSGQPGATGNKTYLWGVGLNANSELNLKDITDATDILDYSPTTNAWTFPKRVHFTAGTTGTGGSVPEDIQIGTTYTIPSSDAGALVGVNNSNPISWTGPTLADNINFYVWNIGSGEITYTPSSGFVNGSATQIIPSNWWGSHFTDNVNSALLLSPTLSAFPDCQDVTGNHLNFTAGTGTLTCGNSGGGGTTTHTTGPLTLGKVVIGNDADDLKVDPNMASDGAGNISLVSVETTGTNGGFTGVEGNGSGLTPAATLDLLYADSTSHCWHQSLNNVDSGCTLAAYTSGDGFGTVFGAPSVVTINQVSDTPWGLALSNSGSTSGIALWTDHTGIGSIQNLDNAGNVNAEIQLRPSGEILFDGNSGANIEFRIPAGATPDFELINGSGGSITGSPRLKWYGATSGNAVISVASVAGTPNPILLPTATGTANGLLTTNGANPQQTSWTLTPALTTLSLTGQFTSTLATGTAPLVVTSTTPVANLTTVPTTYNHSGTQQTATHLVRDRCTLGTDCSVTLSGSAVYTSSSTYDCVAIDRTGANAIQFAPSSGSAFALTGTGTDTISYVCVGN